MARRGRFGHAVLAIVLAVAAGPLRSADVDLAMLRTGTNDAETARVVAGARDGEFRPAADRVAIAAGEGRTWLRLRFDLPTAGDPHADRRVLRFDRVTLDRIAAFLPGEKEPAVDGFFHPGDGSLGPNSFAFAVPHHLRGPQTVYVAVDSRARTTATPRLVDESDFHAAERGVSALLGATYASLAVLVLTALALSVALRDRVQLRFAVFTSATALVLLAVNGHLYRLPGLDALAGWGAYGIYALALLSTALGLDFTRSFLALDALAPRLARTLGAARYAALGVALLCLLDLRGAEAAVQFTAGMALVVLALGNVLASLYAWRRGEPLARAYSLVWSTLVLAVAMRVGLAQGWLPHDPLTLYGFQLVIAFGLFLMSVGLADRVMEFRKQRDRVRQQKEQTDASLAQEQVRRDFAEGLRAQLRDAPAQGDLEWVAFRRLLATLRPLLPQRASAVVADGYHGVSLTVVDPGEAAERMAALLHTRGARLRNLCRGRAPAHLAADERRAEDPDQGGPPLHYAVLPLPLELPAWGALLLERDAGDEFAPAELALAEEFLALAVTATDEAMRQRELRRAAEVDPLTGAFNRRAGDMRLATGLRRAVDAHGPFALLFVDIDHFKQVNDQHGHAAGDECLRAVARAVRATLREGDELVRWGGEEFLVLAPGRAPDEAGAFGEQIRRAVSQLRILNGANELQLTVSIGIAGRLPGEERPEDLVERADRALYEAKHAGRNCVRSAATYGYGAGGAQYEPPPKLSI